MMAKRLSYQEQKAKGQKIFAASVKFGTKSPELNRLTMDYNSTTGLNDTPKGIIDGIKDTLCELDDTLAETSPFVWIPAKFYRLQKSCPELFDIDRDVTKPIDRLSPQKQKPVNQNDKVVEDEINELVSDLSKQNEQTSVKKVVKAKTPKSQRYVGSVASDPAVLALLYSNDLEYTKKKRLVKKQKSTPKMSSRRDYSTRNSTAKKSSRLPGISPLSASRKYRASSSAYVVETPPNSNALAMTTTTTGNNINADVSIAEEEKMGSQVTTIQRKKLKGIATVMDLSELSKGLKRKGSLYKDCYNEYGLEKELKNVYSINAQHWIPRTEQTVINEKMALDRKLRRMIAGLDN
jgi:hypothetical protein